MQRPFHQFPGAEGALVDGRAEVGVVTVFAGTVLGSILSGLIGLSLKLLQRIGAKHGGGFADGALQKVPQCGMTNAVQSRNPRGLILMQSSTLNLR